MRFSAPKYTSIKTEFEFFLCYLLSHSSSLKPITVDQPSRKTDLILTIGNNDVF